ncbi:MAG: hypothetical protein JHC95_08095 [Solirubrobacteraceae bacterium]|nr:hypothetical protein [Solirubrobacteraceae bacterium]
MSTNGAASRDAATAASIHALLNCHAREDERCQFVPVADARGAAAHVVTPEATHVLVVPLPSRQAQVVTAVKYLSPTGRSRFALPVRLSVAGLEPQPLELHTLAALLADELGAGDPRGAGEAATLLERILDSRAAIAGDLAARAGEIETLWSAGPLSFGASEQALLLGHQLHPTPKSRGEMSPMQRRAYAPEAGARFPLRWFAVDPAIVRHASATGTPAPELVRGLLGPGAPDVGDRILLPAHPWEAEHLRSQPELAELFTGGAVEDLGLLGAVVAPTTSVRTVHRADWPWQLKFSLHVRVTNSMRVTLPKELDRAVEAARLQQTILGDRATEVAPKLTILHDPAYLTLERDGEILSGFSVLLRENRWPGGEGEDATALTTLCQDHPYGGRSRLGAIVARLAVETRRSEADVAREWFARFLDVATRSLVRLYLDVGLCFEPHQQNTLLELDGGWPDRCVIRDSQGYFHRELAHADVTAVLPGHGEVTESIFPEALADERLVYYPFVNLTLGVINALGVARLADERVLLGDLREMLEAERAAGGLYPHTLLDRLLDDERWPSKGNLRTRLHDLDELVGDISVQSVYVTIPNPLLVS